MEKAIANLEDQFDLMEEYNDGTKSFEATFYAIYKQAEILILTGLVTKDQKDTLESISRNAYRLYKSINIGGL